jgi:hypothetical protein
MMSKTCRLIMPALVASPRGFKVRGMKGWALKSYRIIR